MYTVPNEHFRKKPVTTTSNNTHSYRLITFEGTALEKLELMASWRHQPDCIQLMQLRQLLVQTRRLPITVQMLRKLGRSRVIESFVLLSWMMLKDY